MKMIRIIRSPFHNTYAKYLSRLALVIQPSEERYHSIVILPDGVIETIPDINTTPYQRSLPQSEARKVMRKEVEQYKILVNYYAHKSNRVNNDPEYITLLKLFPEKAQATIQQLEQWQKRIDQWVKCVEYLEWIIQDQEDEAVLIKVEKLYQSKSKEDFFKSEIGVLPIGEIQTLF